MQLSRRLKRLNNHRALTANTEGIQDVECVVSTSLESPPTPKIFKEKEKKTYLNQVHQPGTPTPLTCNAKNPYRIHSVTPQAPKHPKNA